MAVLTDPDIDKFDSMQSPVKKPSPKVLTDSDIDMFDKQSAMTDNRANPAMQGGANSPALVKARQDVQAAQSRTNPVLTTLKGLSDTADTINKVVPFGDRKQSLNPMTPQGRSNLAGEILKASSLIPGVGSMVGGAAYMAGQAVEDPKKSSGGVALQAAVGAAGSKFAEVALPLAGKAINAVGKGVMDLLPKPVTERIYQLYNEAIRPRTGQFKTKGDLDSYKEDHLNSTLSIVKNPAKPFEDPVTGEIYTKPRNKQDYLQAIDDRQKAVWKDKVQAMSLGATAKGVMIDTHAITEKALSKIVNDKNMKLVEPGLVKECEDLIERSKVSGRQTPEEVENLLSILNEKGASYWANKQKNAANAYIELAGALRKEMEDKIEGALQQGGYLDARKEYGSLKRIKADVLRSTAQQIFKGDATLGDKLLDTFAGEELVRGLLTMNPSSIAMSGTTKAYQLMRQFLRNPDRKIRQMFELADRYTPKATTQSTAQTGWAHAHNPRPGMTSGQPNVSEAEIANKKLPGQPVQAALPNLPNKIGLNRSLPKPSDVERGTGPVIKQGGASQIKLPPGEKRLALPEPTEIKGDGFTMNKRPSKAPVVSEKEVGREPINEQEVGLEGEDEVIKGEKTKKGLERQSQAQEKYYKTDEKKDAKSFLKYMQGKLSSEHLKPKGYLREEHEPISKYRALFSSNGQYSDKVVTEAARVYPRFLGYKKPEDLSGEEIVSAVQKAIKALDDKGVGYLTKNKELGKGQVYSKEKYLGGI